jgi:hypothetical protein
MSKSGIGARPGGAACCHDQKAYRKFNLRTPNDEVAQNQNIGMPYIYAFPLNENIINQAVTKNECKLFGLISKYCFKFSMK